MKKLRVGVVGSGIGASHIEAYKTLPGMYEVVALCDIDLQRGGALAAKHGIPHLDNSLEALFGHDLDFIDICTPAGLHCDQAVTAMQAGFNVIVEKPVARSLTEMDRLEETAKATSKVFCPIFQYRFGHGIQKLHHLIRKGVTGAPSVATAETHWYRAEDYYRAGPWRGTWDGEIGGCFTGHAIHIHDLLCEVLGAVKSVHARMSTRLNGNQTEDMGVLSLEFENGAMASSSISLRSRHEMSRLRFCFADLVAESGLAPYNPGHEPWTFPNDNPDAAARISEALKDFTALPERFVGQFYRLHGAMTEGKPMPVTLADARRSIELLTAAYWSAHTGETVPLPLLPSHPFYGGWMATLKQTGFPHG